MKQSFKDFEAQLRDRAEEKLESSNDSEEEAPDQPNPIRYRLLLGAIGVDTQAAENELEEGVPKEPRLYLCDDRIWPVEVIKKPCDLPPQVKYRARVAKHFLLVTLMSLNAVYGSVIDSYQEEGVEQRSPLLNSISLTEEEVKVRREEVDQRLAEGLWNVPAGMPPSTVLAQHLTEVSANSAVAIVKDANATSPAFSLDNTGYEPSRK